MNRIAGIDFGKARIGLAISDERKLIAQPLETIAASKDPKATAQAIAKVLGRYEIEAIVIGLPLLMNGKEGEMAQLVRSFASVLEQILSLPIVFWDERLTSASVEKMLAGFDVPRKKRAELSDALSAVSILQNYLDAKFPWQQ